VLLTVARIGRPHGLRGEVSLDVRTDDPEGRFEPGAVLRTDPPAAGPLTVEHVRQAGERWIVAFAGVPDRSAAEGLTGVLLVVDPADDPHDDDAWYPHELVGLRAEHVADGRLLGEVVGLEPSPAHDLLLVREPDGALTRVPFVAAIVPVVDVAGGRVVLDPPGGLLAADAANLVVSDETVGDADETVEAPGPDAPGV